MGGLPNQLIQRVAALAPRLQPELLHRVIAAYGLEDCVELVAQATPAQLSHIFDLDLWRAPQPGLDERFDAARFGTWLEVLVEAGADVAAAKLAAMPLPQIVAGLVHHVRVYDVAAVSSYVTTDGAAIDYSRPVRDYDGCEIGGYHVAAIRGDAWDAIVETLAALDRHHPERFVALMRAVRSRSHSRREADGFHALLQNREQMIFDEALERDRRREQRGFASPADARAFLQMARAGTGGGANPIAQHYRRSIRPIDVTGEDAAPLAANEMAIVELLADAGVIPSPRALLESGASPPQTILQQLMQHLYDYDIAAFGERNGELAFLANVLVAGCGFQSRAFTPQEASEAAMATCNLGLEQLAPAGDFLARHDLIGVFQTGWRRLFREVAMFAADRLVDVLGAVRVADADDQRALNFMRVALVKHSAAGTPWRAEQALDALMPLDKPSWAALVAVIAECPVIHAALDASIDNSTRPIDPRAYRFIGCSADIERVREFMRRLPRRLG